MYVVIILRIILIIGDFMTDCHTCCNNCMPGNIDHNGKYEATNYCSMCDNKSGSIKTCTCFRNLTIAMLHRKWTSLRASLIT